MSVVTTVATASHRYYEKRNRSVAEMNIRHMSEALGKPCPEGLAEMNKGDLVNLAMRLHRELPE